MRLTEKHVEAEKMKQKDDRSQGDAQWDDEYWDGPFTLAPFVPTTPQIKIDFFSFIGCINYKVIELRAN